MTSSVTAGVNPAYSSTLNHGGGGPPPWYPHLATRRWEAQMTGSVTAGVNPAYSSTLVLILEGRHATPLTVVADRRAVQLQVFLGRARPRNVLAHGAPDEP